MGKNGNFEDLIAWQKARVLSRDIYRVTRSAEFSKDYSLVDQIRRACISILSNIAEGFERGGRPEFHQFLVVAKGSCGEVRSQLYIALDAGYLDNDAFQNLHKMAHELGKVISGLALAVRSQRDARKKKS
jgi:four helix bundle protein